ncbi:MAG: hypothetical protein H6873_10895 [Hyphomicrobiaceae bacterium]|nr:hypothetical protein [Hyphomicrobiaceae bacterium]
MPEQEKRARRFFGIPGTLLVTLIIFALWGGSYIVVDQMRAMRLSDMSKCIAEDAEGIFNSCDPKIVVTICTTGGDRRCLRETLENLQYFTAEDASVGDDILGDRYACSAPNIPFISHADGAPEQGINACRQPD